MTNLDEAKSTSWNVLGSLIGSVGYPANFPILEFHNSKLYVIALADIEIFDLLTQTSEEKTSIIQVGPSGEIPRPVVYISNNELVIFGGENQYDHSIEQRVNLNNITVSTLFCDPYAIYAINCTTNGYTVFEELLVDNGDNDGTYIESFKNTGQ